MKFFLITVYEKKNSLKLKFFKCTVKLIYFLKLKKRNYLSQTYHNNDYSAKKYNKKLF